MEPDTIGIEIVQDSDAELITLSVIWLRLFKTSSVGPVDFVVSFSRGPTDVSATDLSTSPEVPLPVFGNQTKKLPFLS